MLRSFSLLIFSLAIFTSCVQRHIDLIKKEIIFDEGTRYQRIDGFGVNYTPSQWGKGDQKAVIDKLVDDLGAKLIRFDCTGLANWLDPSRRNKEGKWNEDYLDSVYRSPAFSDAWEAFRYFGHKNTTVFFNVSGRINPLLGRKDDPQHLADFNGYAEMCATLLHYARENEKLDFRFFAPFNEVNLGYPEGPRILPSEIVTAVQAIVQKLDEHGLKDVQLIVPDDAGPGMENLKALLTGTGYAGRIMAFGTHMYGNGAEGDGDNWYTDSSGYAKYAAKVRNSLFSNASLWMTEYGDLDQSGEIEFEFAWRSTRRLMEALADGYNAALSWDAFDNFHQHDKAWATYGLMKTDTIHWLYMPKKRYYAAKQVYLYVKPGMYRVALHETGSGKNDVYKAWHDPLRNLRMEGFVSSDETSFTIIGMNQVEKTVQLSVHLEGMDPVGNDRKIYYYRTTPDEDCVKVDAIEPKTNVISITIPPHAIFTLTTIHSYFEMHNIFNQ